MTDFIAAFQAPTSMQFTHHTIPSYSTKMGTPVYGCRSRGRYVGVFGMRAREVHTPIILASFNGDDEDRYYTKQPKRKRQRDPIRDSIRKDNNKALTLVESAISFLSKRISLPSIVSLVPGEKDNVEIPLVYIVFIVLSTAILPLTTWLLQSIFFGIYLTLGTASMVEYDNINDRSETFDSEEDEYNGIIPLAAFTGAIASAAFLSPQGLMLNAPISFTTPVAIIAVALSGLTILMGIQDTRDEELRLQEKYIREQRTLKEKKQMELWDDEMQRSSDGGLIRLEEDE